MAYVRKVKTGSGATAVQIVRKQYGELIVIEHLGSANSEEAVKRLVRKGKEKLAEKQRKLFDLRSVEGKSTD